MTQTPPSLPYRDVSEQELDGTRNVLLAPVRGTDARQTLPAQYFVRRARRFVAKFIFAMSIIVACFAVIAASLNSVATVVAMLVLGLMYAHLLELQHECLHEHAFASRRKNRAVGTLCGLFMLSSYSHYKYEHLRHHAFLGTPRNQEFFEYRSSGLDSWLGFIREAFSLRRYRAVASNTGRSCLGRRIPGVARQSTSMKKMHAEYRLFAIAVMVAATVTVWTGESFLILAWLLPTLLVSEATHFLLELPEHFGLNTETDDNVLSNTRTVNASRFAEWFTNYNNYHTAHHYHQGVPMASVRELSALVSEQFEAVEASYWTFYKKVVSGELKAVSGRK